MESCHSEHYFRNTFNARSLHFLWFSTIGSLLLYCLSIIIWIIGTWFVNIRNSVTIVNRVRVVEQSPWYQFVAHCELSNNQSYFLYQQFHDIILYTKLYNPSTLNTILTIMCRNLAAMKSWVGCVLTDWVLPDTWKLKRMGIHNRNFEKDLAISCK